MSFFPEHVPAALQTDPCPAGPSGPPSALLAGDKTAASSPTLDAYVRQTLDGVAAATAAPGAEPNGRRLSLEGFGAVEHAVPLDVVSALDRVRDKHGLSDAALFCATWALLLARFTGDEDVVFGLAGVAPSADSYAVLPFRVRVPGEMRVRDFFAAVHVLENSAQPFAALVETGDVRELRPGSTSLELESVLDVGSRGAVESPSRAPAVPLTMRVTRQADGGLSLRVEFERARFRPAMPARIAAAFVFLLEELSASDERLVTRIDAVPPADREALIATFNATARPFRDDLLIHEHFEQQVRARPEAAAVETQTKVLTFRELDQLANRLANALRARGARPGMRVGICLDRDVLLVAAVLAVSKSGAAYVPFDVTYPAARLQALVSDAAPAVVVTEARFADRFTGELLLADTSDLAAFPDTPPERLATPEDDCYVIYTSGSTGKPKGVVLQHRAVVNTCEWVTREFGIGPGDRALFVTSPCFDLSVYDMFGALGAGATLVVAEHSLLNDAQALGRTIVARRITVWNSAPATLELAIPFTHDSQAESRLRLVMLSGDFIPLALVAELKAQFPAARLMSLGGATEAAIWSNFYPVGEVAPDWVSVPYGRPLQNCRYYALDARLAPVPIGVVGELHIGGACLARGYLNRAELTAARFVPDPFSGEPGARLYRTGDRVRYFEDGNLEILGRTDNQVKIRGYRIELREVETALAALPDVANAACIATELNAAGQRSLIGYVVPAGGAPIREVDLKRRLARVLPDFMIPARIAVLNALPLSSNGKVDRKALPHVAEVTNDADVFAAPRPGTETAMAAIWRRILNRAAVSRDDDFFLLGGHSILAVDLFQAVRTTFGVELAPTTILEHPTVASFAAQVDAARANRTAPQGGALRAVVSFQRDGVAPELFCIGGLGGNPLGIRRLAAELGGDQPVHGLYNPSFDARSVQSIEDLAQELYEEMRRIRPQGPYYLSGFSAGGVIAFELARMLRANGHSVPLLIMLDAYNPTLPRWSTPERIGLFLAMCWTSGPRYGWRRLRARLRYKWRQARLDWLGSPAHDTTDFHAMQATFTRALERYEPKPYPGDVLLIRAAPHIANEVDYRTHESNGWRDAVDGNLEIVKLHCRHEDVLRERAADVARIMRRALDAVRAKTPEPHAAATGQPGPS